jgi:hypothetical protein
MPVDAGNELELALNQLNELSRSHRTVWGTPIPWSARPVFVKGFVVAPAYGPANQVIVCTYQVPRGHTALICGVVLQYAGGGGSALPGNILYTIDVDNPNAAVVSPAPGYIEKDFNFVPFQLSDFVLSPPWPVEFRHDEGETIRIKAQTVNTVAVGPGNFVSGALVGWQWPSQGWEQ